MSSYRVELDLFSGPLDLLLYLVRRNEVDPANLPIAAITAQFLEFLRTLQFLDFDIVGEFVVMASTLLEIKSRCVLPQAPTEEEPAVEAGGDDPRSELVARLLEYKRLRDAAAALDERATQWQLRFPRLSDDRPTAARDHAADPIREVELWDLVSALSRVLQRRVVEQSASIQYDDTPISVYSERIATRVREQGRVAFSDFFEGTHQRSKIVSIFLAILELLRHHQFRAEQPLAYGEIYVLPPLETEAASPDSTSAAAVDAAG